MANRPWLGALLSGAALGCLIKIGARRGPRTLLCGCAYGGALVTDPVELDVLCKPRPRVFRGIPIEAEARFTPRFTPPALSLTGEREYLVYAYDW